MKRKLIPPFLMLLTGAITSIIMYSFHYESQSMFLILFSVLLAFYFIGSLLKVMLDIFDRQNEEVLKAKEAAEQAEAEMADISSEDLKR